MKSLSATKLSRIRLVPPLLLALALLVGVWGHALHLILSASPHCSNPDGNVRILAPGSEAAGCHLAHDCEQCKAFASAYGVAVGPVSVGLPHPPKASAGWNVSVEPSVAFDRYLSRGPPFS